METIVDGKWLWFNIANDLQTQGGLADVIIDPSAVRQSSFGGEYKGEKFLVSWVRNDFMLISMKTFSQDLINAFAKVVAYDPFCRYSRNGLCVVEWDKNSIDVRFAELREETGVTELTELESL